ncbi:hypothetical protein [Oceanobacillus sp. CF4.6]|uniref:hypothetical protein n=1 Tax=Oceanobacillus sp. CF4.6 TaxID=3373080 RepID=UPI003EE61BA5
MPKIQYKEKEGVLHIGGGRFFYAQQPAEVDEKEITDLLNKYSDLEEVEEEPEQQVPPQQDDGYTKTSIKKLNADEQRELIAEFGGDPEETNNEDDRIELILQLQEEKNAEKGE